MEEEVKAVIQLNPNGRYTRELASFGEYINQPIAVTLTKVKRYGYYLDREDSGYTMHLFHKYGDFDIIMIK